LRQCHRRWQANQNNAKGGLEEAMASVSVTVTLINVVIGALGHEAIAMPATPEAVWKAAGQRPETLAAEQRGQTDVRV
jgi:hypothetical protein